jgi:hypothetical protein
MVFAQNACVSCYSSVRLYLSRCVYSGRSPRVADPRNCWLALKLFEENKVTQFFCRLQLCVCLKLSVHCVPAALSSRPFGWQYLLPTPYSHYDKKCLLNLLNLALKPIQNSQYSDWAKCWDIQSSNPTTSKGFYFLQSSTPPMGTTHPPVQRGKAAGA